MSWLSAAGSLRRYGSSATPVTWSASFRWHAPDPHLTDSEFRRFETEMIDAAFREGDRARYRRYLAEAPVAGQFPHYVALLWDELGYLWVRRYDWVRDNNWTGRRWNTGPGEWWVFDPDGRWLGSVHVPDELDPAQIGPDYILSIHRDELDVERVRLYKLMR